MHWSNDEVIRKIFIICKDHPIRMSKILYYDVIEMEQRA